ncbi:7TM diverse intracellular signaling domain-containing protein [Wenyingzhuangia sp. IMCC45574]
MKKITINKNGYIAMRLILGLFLCCNSLFAQVSYYQDVHGNQTLETVQTQTFVPVSEKINEGLHNGVFWLRMVNNSKKIRTVELSSAKLFNFDVYKGVDRVNNTVFPTFTIPNNTTAYIRIQVNKEAFIPVHTFTKGEFQIHQRNQLLRLGLYYGFAIMVIIINLFYFFSFKDYTFLYYALFLTTISIALMFRDGLIPTLTNSLWFIKEGEMIVHVLIPICGAIFAGTYLQHNLYLPKIKYVTAVMMLVVLVCYIVFLSTKKVFWYALGDIIAINVLTLYWLTGVYLFNKNAFAKFFTIAYFLILVLAFDFFICPLYGIPNIGVTTNLLKIGGVFEMLTLSYAVVYRMKFLQKENDKIRDDLYAYTQEIKKLTEDLENNQAVANAEVPSYNLTPRQTKILSLLTDGLTNKEIAEEMNISINTVKYHIKAIYDELQISSRKEVMLLNIQ